MEAEKDDLGLNLLLLDQLFAETYELHLLIISSYNLSRGAYS